MDLYDQAQKNNEPQSSDLPDLSSLMSPPQDSQPVQTQPPPPQIEPISALDVPVTPPISDQPTVDTPPVQSATPDISPLPTSVPPIANPETPMPTPQEVKPTDLASEAVISNSPDANTLPTPDSSKPDTVANTPDTQTFMHMSDIPRDTVPSSPVTETVPSPAPLDNSPPNTTPPVPPNAATPSKKFTMGRGILFAVLALAILTLPVIGFFVTRPNSQTDTRTQAAKSNCAIPGDPDCDITSPTNTPPSSTSNSATTPATQTQTVQSQAGCSSLGNPCENNGCCTGLVCQGNTGNRVCQQPATTPDQWCGGTPGSCGRLIAFHCNSDFPSGTPESGCFDNPIYIQNNDAAGWAQARAHVAGCGQIDVVCKSGPKENQLCGDFEIFKDNCGPGSQPTPIPISQCRNLKIYRDGIVVKTKDYNTLRPQQQIQFAVVSNQEAARARFYINGKDPVISTEKNENGEFFINWEIPEVGSQRTFTVQAEVRINGVWQ